MKARHILGLAVLMAVAGSCKKNQNQDTNSFSASIEVDESRTYLDNLDHMKVKWSAGDQIIVYGDGAPNAPKTYTLSSGATTQTATFTTTGGVQPASTYRAFYPASSCRGVSGDVFTFSMPDTQTYTANGFMNNLNPMAGKNDGNAGTLIGFKNAFAILKLQTKGNRTVSKVEVTVPSDNYLYGTFTFDPTTGTTTHTSGGGQTITLDCSANPVALNATTDQDFYIVLPPGSIDNGFDVNYYQAGSATPFFTQNVPSNAGNLALDRNTIKRMSVTANATSPQVQNLLPVMITSAWQVKKKDASNATSTTDVNNIINGVNNYGFYFSHDNSKEYHIRPTSPDKVSLVRGHTYYVRFYARVDEYAGTSNVEFFWPEDGNCRFIPKVGDNLSTTLILQDNQWKLFSRKWTNFTAYPTDGSYSPRIDHNTANGSRHCYVSGAMLIDLTAAGLESLNESQLNAKRYIYGNPIDSDTW